MLISQFKNLISDIRFKSSNSRDHHSFKGIWTQCLRSQNLRVMQGAIK
jgi:hypothetical protein